LGVKGGGGAEVVYALNRVLAATRRTSVKGYVAVLYP
jgi:hypothetical protein